MFFPRAVFYLRTPSTFPDGRLDQNTKPNKHLALHLPDRDLLGCLTCYDSMLLNMLNEALPNDVVVEIAKKTGDDKVTDYATYRSLAITLDNAIAPHRRDRPRPAQPPVRIEYRPPPGPPTRQATTPAQPPPFRFPPRQPAPAAPPPPRPNRDVVPMEIDRRKAGVECYHCHQKGHFQYECPNKQRQVRAFWMDLHPADRVVLAEHVAQAPESDFEGKEGQVADNEMVDDDVETEDFTPAQQ